MTLDGWVDGFMRDANPRQFRSQHAKHSVAIWRTTPAGHSTDGECHTGAKPSNRRCAFGDGQLAGPITPETPHS